MRASVLLASCILLVALCVSEESTWTHSADYVVPETTTQGGNEIHADTLLSTDITSSKKPSSKKPSSQRTSSADKLKPLPESKTTKVEAPSVAKALKNYEMKLTQDYKDLKAGKKKARAKKRKARHEFRAARKKLRHEYRKCRKQVRHHKMAAFSMPQCAFFKVSKATKSKKLLLQIREDDDDVMGKKSRKQKRAKRKQKRKQKRAKRKQKRAKRSSKRQAKRKLRGMRREKRREIKKKWKAAKKEFRSYRRKVMKARMKAKYLPKVIKMVQPKLDSALAKLDISSNGGDTAAGVMDNLPLLEIKSQEVLRKFITMKVDGLVRPKFDQLFAKLESVLWKTVGMIMETIKEALVSAVGSIPFVGGILAAAIGMVIDAVYAKIQTLVNGMLAKLKNLIVDKIVTTCVNMLFKTGIFQAIPKKALAAAVNAKQAQVTKATQQSCAKSSVDGEAAAKKAEKDVSTMGKAESSKAKKDEAKDKKVESKEDKNDHA